MDLLSVEKTWGKHEGSAIQRVQDAQCCRLGDSNSDMPVLIVLSRLVDPPRGADRAECAIVVAEKDTMKGGFCT
jgi:hypothetical protein